MIAGAAGGGGGAAIVAALLLWWYCFRVRQRQASPAVDTTKPHPRIPDSFSVTQDLAPAEPDRRWKQTDSAGGIDESTLAIAPESIAVQVAPPPPAHRVRALVVGCGSYALLEDLDNPPHDAAAVAAMLEAAGAEVLLLLNPTRDELDKALRMLSDIQRKPFPQALVEAAKTRKASLKRKVSAAPAAVTTKTPPPPHRSDAADSDNVIGMLYFAGHGMEISGENLLVPSDFTLDEEVLKGSTKLSDAAVQTLAKQGCVSIREALGHMSSADFYVALALLDCCRDWPLPSILPKTRGAKTRGGMASVEAGALSAREGAIIGFATKDGHVALDDANTRPGHSPFTAALLEHLVRTDLPLAMLIPEVTDSVMKDTQGRQVPELKTSGLGKTGANLRLFAETPSNKLGAV